MSEIKVIGNKEVYHSTQSVDLISIDLIGEFNLNSKSRIELRHGEFYKVFNDTQHLLGFCKEIQGSDLSSLLLAFSKYNLSDEYFDYLNNTNKIELSLLKSLFIIYYWIHLAVDENGVEIDLEKMIYDNFTLDLSLKHKKQRDIYFISKKYLNNKYLSKIERLVQLNLLSKLEVQNTNKRNYFTYFIPFIKPGVNRSLFGDIEGFTREELVNFWNSLLNERNRSIHNWQKNRF